MTMNTSTLCDPPEYIIPTCGSIPLIRQKLSVLEYELPKPAISNPNDYSLHQIVAALCGGSPSVWRATPSSIILRTSKVAFSGLTAKPPRTFANGETLAFQLRVSASKKSRGKHYYLPHGDQESRTRWLSQRCEALGFHVLSETNQSRSTTIQDQKNRRFRMDCTDFVGELQITDATLFQHTWAHGVNGPGRAFGFGLLLV